MTTLPPTLPKKDRLLIREVAAFHRVTERTIRNWIEQGKMKAVKTVGGIRIPYAEALKVERKISQY